MYGRNVLCVLLLEIIMHNCEFHGGEYVCGITGDNYRAR